MNTGSIGPHENNPKWARITKCVENLKDEKTSMSKEMLYGFCTKLELKGYLDEAGHWKGHGDEAKTMAEVAAFLEIPEDKVRSILTSLKEDIQFAEIKGLPIFKAGTYHDGKSTYSDADIDGMPDAFLASQSAFLRPVKVTHGGKENPLAQGIVEKIYTGIKDGAKHLFADLKNVPEALATAIRERRILGHSVEIYPQFQGQKNVVRALAFLGADIPEVKGLGDLASYVHSEDPDHIIIEFSADAQASGADKEAGSKESGKTNHQSTNQTRKEVPLEPFRTFGSQAEFDAFVQGQKAEAVKGFVPQAELDRLKSEQEAAKDATHFSEIESKVKGLMVPNDQKKALPPFVSDKLTSILKSIPRTVQFGEKGKETSTAAAIIDLFAEVKKIGLVDFSESAPATKAGTADQVATWEKEAKAEFAEIPVAYRVSSEAAYVTSYVELKKNEVKK